MHTLSSTPLTSCSLCAPVQLYPGGGSVVKLMETLSDWLLSMPLQRIPYQAVLDLVDNKMRVRCTLNTSAGVVTPEMNGLPVTFL